MIQALIVLVTVSAVGAIPLLIAFGFSEIIRRWG